MIYKDRADSTGLDSEVAMTNRLPLPRRSAIAVSLVLVCVGTSAGTGYRPSYENETGVELGFVYFGSTGCGFCNTTELKQAVLRAKEILSERARASGMSFSTTGVALDWSTDRGVKFLEDVGPFDQIVVGRQEYNLAVLEFVAKDAGASAGLPQVVVYQQELRVTPTRVWAGRRRLVRRLMGALIVRWVNEGAPLGEE